jgi:hypothetical protein
MRQSAPDCALLRLLGDTVSDTQFLTPVSLSDAAPKAFAPAVPALRKRGGEDIKLLALYFFKVAATKLGRYVRGFSDEAMSVLVEPDLGPATGGDAWNSRSRDTHSSAPVLEKDSSRGRFTSGHRDARARS